MAGPAVKKVDRYWSCILRGLVISVISAVVMCALISFMIVNGYIPEKWSGYIPMLILCLSSFCGAQYSRCKTTEKTGAICIATVISYLVVLLMVNLMIAGGRYTAIVPGTIAATVGTLLSFIGRRGKRRRSSSAMHYRNR